MEDANAWLRKTHPPLHNRRLTRKARLDGETAFVPLVDPSVLDGVLWGRTTAWWGTTQLSEL